ncbi:MAG: HlyD family efflux transporter periplasmic adaptor subunit [Oscillospiraceae bacterium]|nr:HlyD family efflux transporter periplasmic adaptor subunit [Oscillospiraceae bacterium]
MEVKEKSKKRELIKTIAIIFLVILLILTFFSNTFMNYSLPEVATQVVTSGTINARIRGSGTVSPNESYEVVIDQTREVRSVCVRVGDTVAEGDLLFVLGDMESEELKTAQDALQTLELEYQRKILTLSKEYATGDMNVRSIQAALERAIADRDANVVTEAEISYAKGDLAQAESQLSEAKLILEELKAAETNGQGEDSKYAAAKAKVDELQKKVDDLTAQISADEESLAKLDTGSDLSGERAVQDAKNALDRAQTKWASDWAANLTYLQQLPSLRLGSTPHAFSSNERVEIERLLSAMNDREAKLKKDYEDYVSSFVPGEDGASPEPDRNVYVYDKVRAAYNAVLTSQDAVDTAQETYNRAVEDQKNATNSTAQQRQTLQQRISSARGELSAAQAQLQQAKQELSSAATSNSQLREQIKVYESSERDLTARVATLTSGLEELTAKKTAYEAAVKEVETQQKALEEALSGKDIDKQLNNLDLEAMRLDIEQKRQEVAKYQEASVDTEIKSKVSGVISAINVTAGKNNTAGQAMATIDVVDRGFTIKVSVTNEQAKQVRVGDTADVTTNYWGSEVTATLEAITGDQSAPGQKKLLVFRITGDVEAGSTINLSIGQRSMTSDTVVPKSALREDTNGKFVLVVTSKSTPLGNRYTATRVDVQVVAEDDNNAAVTGVAANDYVITTSSKPIAPGSQVRMVENS